MKVIESVKWVHNNGGASFFSKVPGNTPAWSMILRLRQPQLESHARLDAKLLEVMFRMFPDKLEWQDYDGLTPLHRAVLNGSIPAIEMLVRMGVDVNRETVDTDRRQVYAGWTAINLALMKRKMGVLTDEVRAGGIVEIR